MSPRTTDELLREYLESKPNELLGKLFDEIEATKKSMAETFASYRRECTERHVLVIAALGGHDARLGRLERAKSDPPPRHGDLEQYRSGTGSGAYHIPAHELEEALRQVEARDALGQKQAFIRAIGKVAIALVTAGALFAAGTLWRDLVARAPQNQTSITTIAPGPVPVVGVPHP